jgi:hypothetical protein
MILRHFPTSYGVRPLAGPSQQTNLLQLDFDCYNLVTFPEVHGFVTDLLKFHKNSCINI